MKKIKLFLLRQLAKLFAKYFEYDCDALDSRDEFHIWFKAKNQDSLQPVLAHFRILKRNDITQKEFKLDKYNYTPSKIDSGWLFRNVKLASTKEVTLLVTTRENRKHYLENMVEIRKDRERFEQYPFETNQIMDIEVKVLGDGNGLSAQEREEVCSILENNKLKFMR